MHLHSYRLRNFRRLKDAHIELADDISIFVGSNNSGKTSATQAIYAFVTGGKDRFSLMISALPVGKPSMKLGTLAWLSQFPTISLFPA